MLVLPATLVTAGPRLDARHMIFCPFMLAKGGSLTGFFSRRIRNSIHYLCVFRAWIPIASTNGINIFSVSTRIRVSLWIQCKPVFVTCLRALLRYRVLYNVCTCTHMYRVHLCGLYFSAWLLRNSCGNWIWFPHDFFKTHAEICFPHDFFKTHAEIEFCFPHDFFKTHAEFCFPHDFSKTHAEMEFGFPHDFFKTDAEICRISRFEKNKKYHKTLNIPCRYFVILTYLSFRDWTGSCATFTLCWFMIESVYKEYITEIAKLLFGYLFDVFSYWSYAPWNATTASLWAGGEFLPPPSRSRNFCRFIAANAFSDFRIFSPTFDQNKRKYLIFLHSK